MKRTLLCLLALSAAAAIAAPVLTANPYPSTAVQPTSASVTAGSQTLTCTLPSTAGGLVPTCDLAPLTSAPGTTSLVLTVSNSNASPTTSSSSAPFSFTWKGSSYAAPAMAVASVGGRVTLVSQVYVASALAPTVASLSGGPSPISCTVPAVSGGVQVQCDLSSITAAGSYTLTVASSVPYGCNSVASSATCNGAGSASSAPFAYVLSAPLASPAGIRVQ